MTPDCSTPVVVLRSGHHGGLGIVRSLGRLGVPVYCVDAAWYEPAFSSRYCRRRFILSIEDQPRSQSVASLLEIGRIVGGRPVLVPTTDRTAIWAAENGPDLQEVFRFPLQPSSLVRTLCDKSHMQELAARCGVPTAQSVVPKSKDDVVRYLETATFPVMVKATDADSLRRRVGGTKFLVHTPRELLDLCARAVDGPEPNLLVQEFIPGEDWMFDGYFDETSRCLFGITGKKIRRFPVRTGVTSLGVCLRNDAVAGITADFMKAIGYRGILDIGFRHDRRDGSYKVLDVNPRIGCTFRLFTSTGGLDVARALYMNMTGQSLPPYQAAEGRKWIVEDFDFFSSIRSFFEGTLSLREWAGSLSGVREAACFAIDDPLPSLMMAAADFWEFHRWVRGRRGARPLAAPVPQVSSD